VSFADDLLDMRLGAFLEHLATEDPAPAAGSVAALAVTMAAGLCAKAARASRDWPEAQSAVAQAERLRRRTAPLAQSDADAYEEALAVLHLPDQLEVEVRDMAIGQVLARSAEIPLVIAEAGADVASLAALIAHRGAADRRAEAVVAAVLAEAATRSAAHLVAINLVVTATDERVVKARAASEVASAACRSAFEAAPT
jgi:formiminotetrahydrofolate cyclodeaminase